MVGGCVVKSDVTNQNTGCDHYTVRNSWICPLCNERSGGHDLFD